MCFSEAEAISAESRYLIPRRDLAMIPILSQTKRPKIGIKDEDASLGPSESKRPATEWSKALSKMEGDVSLLRQMLEYVDDFMNQKGDSEAELSHPADMVIAKVGSDPDISLRSWTQVTHFLREYAAARASNGVVLPKPSVEGLLTLGQHCKTEVLQVPIQCLHLRMPDGGILPPLLDWSTVWRSMLLGGLHLDREPIDVTPIAPQPSFEHNSLRIVKGYTRSTCVALALLMVSEVDLQAEGSMEILKPLFPFLDRCVTLPMKLSFLPTEKERAFEGMLLSCRGAERQAPSAFVIGMKFEQLLGDKYQGMSVESAVHSLAEEYNNRKGTAGVKRYQLSDEVLRGVTNLIAGTSHETRVVMKNHLCFHKWSESALSAELLRQKFWLVGSKVKVPENPVWENLLTMTAASQSLFMQRVVKTFAHRTRKLRPVSRARARWTVEEWHMNACIACIFQKLIDEARLESPEPDKAVENLRNAFFAGDYFSDIEAFIATKPLTFKVSSLAVWDDLVTARPQGALSALMGDAPMSVELAEEAAAAASYTELEARLSADELECIKYRSALQKREDWTCAEKLRPLVRAHFARDPPGLIH